MKSSRRFLDDAPSTDLRRALLELVLRPRTTLWAAWSWKAACLSAILRTALFGYNHIRAGRPDPLRTIVVEALFVVIAAGMMGAVSQRLRDARPYWATAIVVWLGMPALMLVAQYAVHHAAAIPHITLGFVGSFCFTAIASSYSWYAMKHGALLGGEDATTLHHDINALPRITRDYILCPVDLLRGKPLPRRSNTRARALTTKN